MTRILRSGGDAYRIDINAKSESKAVQRESSLASFTDPNWSILRTLI